MRKRIVNNLIAISILLASMFSFCFADTVDSTCSIPIEAENNIDTNLDVYIENTDTYFMRSDNLYKMLNTTAPYSRRLAIGVVDISDEAKNRYTDEILELFRKDYGFEPYLFLNSNIVYQTNNCLHDSENKISSTGEFTRVSVTFVPENTILSQSVFSGGGLGVVGECLVDINSFEDMDDYYEYYDEIDFNYIQTWNYSYSDSPKDCVMLSTENFETIKNITATSDIKNKIAIEKGINVVTFTAATPFNRNFTWYEVYVGVDNSEIIDAYIDPAPRPSILNRIIDIFLILIVFLCLGSVIYRIFIRKKQEKDIKEKEVSQKKYKSSNITYDTATGHYTYENLKDKDIIDAEYREVE